jgi:hypothetical protein
MTGKFKLLILLVALVALPLRGMAAVAMLHCAEDRHDAAVAGGGAGHHHGDHAAGAAEQSDHHAHEAAAHDEPAGHPASAVTSACSACAACCVGGAVAPPVWPAFAFAPIGASRIPYVEQRFTGVVPARFDRPPRVLSL